MNEINIINKLEQRFTTRLKDLKFKNGIATQRNSLYSFCYGSECEEFYSFKKDDKLYRIEKSITRRFITPNERVQPHNQRIIFPYRYSKEFKKNVVIPEEEMRRDYPLAYSYFLEHKEELDKRASDKNISAWYAYDRSQGLNDFGNRMYLPCIAKNVYTIISEDDSEIMAAGYAIYDEDIDYLKLLSSILTSSLFSYYIAMVSKLYSKGYYFTAKNLVKYFSIPSKQLSLDFKLDLSDDEVFELFKLTSEEKR